MVFEAFPVDAPDTHQDVKLLHQKVEELIQKQLGVVTTTPSQPPLESPVVNGVISFTLNILETLVAGNKQYVDRFMMPLVRVFQRLAREMATASAQFARQVGALTLGCTSSFTYSGLLTFALGLCSCLKGVQTN